MGLSSERFSRHAAEIAEGHRGRACIGCAFTQREKGHGPDQRPFGAGGSAEWEQRTP